jgi:hypothetical protein
MAERGLGRRPPTDDKHLRRWSLTPETMPTVATPVVLGLNWWSGMDTPQQDSRHAWWVKPTGTIRGGHAICIKPPRLTDNDLWWHFYDQGEEGACVGYATSRMMTLLNRVRYNGQALYETAKRIDEWDGEDYDGTSVRAGMDVARLYGMYRIRAGITEGPLAADGINENRWATSVEQIAFCLDPETSGARIFDAGYVTLVNSWGTSYSHLTRLSLEDLNRLIFQEDGEATVVIDKP